MGFDLRPIYSRFEGFPAVERTAYFAESNATAVSLSQRFCLVSATNFWQNNVQRCAPEYRRHFWIVVSVGDRGNRTQKNAFRQGLNQHH